MFKPSWVRAEIVLAWVAGLPFALRFLQGTVMKYVMQMIYNKFFGGVNPFQEALPILNKDIDSNRGLNFRATVDGAVSHSWTNCRQMHGYNKLTAITIGVIRFFFWHLLQPMMYFTVFYAYYDVIGEIQVVLGSVIAVRELIYVLMILLATWSCPMFLMVDIGNEAEWDQYIISVLIYTMTPDKFVFMVLVGYFWGIPNDSRCDCCGPMMLCFGFSLGMMDLCGIVALGVGLHEHIMPAPLAVGYSITALSGLCFIGLLVLGILDGLGLFDYIRRNCL